jgi:AraC-like DNA-binding protein
MERRIEWAKRMMHESDEPLSQIALACGLADQAHFTRLFRKFVGMPPSQWRRCTQGNNLAHVPGNAPGHRITAVMTPAAA